MSPYSRSCTQFHSNPTSHRQRLRGCIDCAHKLQEDAGKLKKKETKKKKFMLFSEHSGSLLRRQPGELKTKMELRGCIGSVALL